MNLTVRVLPHSAYRAARHRPVGIDAAHIVVDGHSAAVAVALVEEREFLQSLELGVGYIRDHRKRAVALFLVFDGQRLQKIVFPLVAVAARESEGHRVGYRVDGVDIALDVELLAAEVETDGVEPQIGGQNRTVGSEDVAAFGLYHRCLRQLFGGFLVPVAGVDNGCVDKFDKHCGGCHHNDENHYGVAEQDVLAVVVLHCRRGDMWWWLISLQCRGDGPEQRDRG